MPMIVHLTTVHTRGDVRIFLKQARTLAREWPGDVALVVADGKGDDLSDPGLAIHDIGRPAGGRLGRAILGSLRTIRLVRRLKPRVVHFHDPELIVIGMIHKLLGVKVVYDVHEDLPRQIYSKPWIPGIVRRPVAMAVEALEFVAARVFDAVVCATPHIAARFPPRKTVAIQNFPLLAELASVGTASVSDRAPLFGYVGGIAAARGARETIEAMTLVRSEPRARLALAGGFSPAALEAELRASPGWSRVDYWGLVDRKAVADLLGSVRAGLVLFHPHPNHVHAQPNKMFEYMSAGIPVIASDFPLWRNIIDGARCGILVDPMQPADIARAMDRVLAEPAEAEAMGKRGRDAVESLYNWEAESVALVSLYKKLLPQTASGPS